MSLPAVLSRTSPRLYETIAPRHPLPKRLIIYNLFLGMAMFTVSFQTLIIVRSLPPASNGSQATLPSLLPTSIRTKRIVRISREPLKRVYWKCSIKITISAPETKPITFPLINPHSLLLWRRGLFPHPLSLCGDSSTIRGILP
ncbi:hypothetical protein J6590_028226 [Homalodisca vitripennis]|nr:hypothetical protein J6590_028226 [Homalodisca vitripennis]